MLDYFNLQKKLVAVHQQGISVADDVVCGACHRKMVIKGTFKFCISQSNKYIVVVRIEQRKIYRQLLSKLYERKCFE